MWALIWRIAKRGNSINDVVGGYQRLGVFDLEVDRRRRHPATFVNEEGPKSS